MRIQILTLGSRGDVQPYVALGAALAASGHAVTVTTGAGFDELIARRGLAARSLSIDYRELAQRPETVRALRSIVAMARLFRSAKDLVRRQLDEMWAIAQDLRPELIVYHPKAFAAQHLAEALGTVALPAAVIPGFAPTGAYPSPLLPFTWLGTRGNRWSHALLLRLMTYAFGRTVQDWRRGRLGLAGRGPRDPFGVYDPAGRDLIRLHGFSRHLVPRPDDWGARERQTGYWSLDSAEDWQPPEDLARFLTAGPSPVYVGFGSMPGEAGRQTRAVLDALAASGQRGLLATGWGGLRRAARDERVHVLEAAPHDWLFPRCAAVVHHGGAGTTHEALRWGRPSVICPLFGDQPFWGRRVAALGASPPPLPKRHLSADALARAIEAALAPEVAARAAELGQALREEPGAAGAAREIARALS